MDASFTIEWTIPGSPNREPQLFFACGHPGSWEIMSRYPTEIRWHHEVSTPELCQLIENLVGTSA